MAILPRTYLPSTAGFNTLLNQLYRRQYDPYAAMGQAALAPINTYIQQLFRQDQLQQQSDLQMRNQLALEQARNADIYGRAQQLAASQAQLNDAANQRTASAYSTLYGAAGPQITPVQNITAADTGLPDMSVPSFTGPYGMSDQSAPPDMYPGLPKTAGDEASWSPPTYTPQAPAPTSPLPEVTDSTYTLGTVPEHQTAGPAENLGEALRRLTPERAGFVMSNLSPGERENVFKMPSATDLEAERAVKRGQAEKAGVETELERRKLATFLGLTPEQQGQALYPNAFKPVTPPLKPGEMNVTPDQARSVLARIEANPTAAQTDPLVTAYGGPDAATKAMNRIIASDEAAKLQLQREANKGRTDEAYTRKNPSLSGQVFDKYGHLLRGTYSLKDIEDNGYLVIKSPTDRQVIGQFAMIEKPFQAMNNAVEKGVLPQATGGSATDTVSALKNWATGEARQFSDPDVTKFKAAQQNILFPLIGLEGGGKRQAIQELRLRMQANPKMLDTDLAAAAQADQIADIVETRATAAGVELSPSMQAEMNRAHENFTRIAMRVSGSSAAPTSLFQRFFGGGGQSAPAAGGGNRVHVQLSDGTAGWLPKDQVDPATMKVIP